MRHGLSHKISELVGLNHIDKIGQEFVRKHGMYALQI